MTAPQRGCCPVCHRIIAVTATGHLIAHADTVGNACPASGIAFAPHILGVPA